MSRNLEEQMRLSLRAILSKQMKGKEEDKHRVIASFISDESGFPLTGLKRIENSIKDMQIDEFEQISAILPQIWEETNSSSQGLGFLSEADESEINHFTIGFKKKGSPVPYLEMMVTRLDELFLTSILLTENR
ncbi:MAG: hypothetical protein ACFFAJ_14945 [Candidatus Hodarchaeota archaeon]